MADVAVPSRPTIQASPARAGLARFLCLLGAAVLVGGLGAAAGIGATAFGSSDILTFEQAGRFMARVFEASIYVEVAAVALLAVGSLAGGRFARAAVLAAALGAVLVGGHGALAKGMRDLRDRHGGSLAALPKDHADRVAFGARHGIYNVLALGLLGVGVAVLVAGARPEAAGAARAGDGA